VILLQIWAQAACETEISALAGENVWRIREGLTRILLPWATGRAPHESGARELATRSAESIISIMQGFMVRSILDPDLSPERFADSVGAFLDAHTTADA